MSRFRKCNPERRGQDDEARFRSSFSADAKDAKSWSPAQGTCRRDALIPFLWGPGQRTMLNFLNMRPNQISELVPCNTNKNKLPKPICSFIGVGLDLVVMQVVQAVHCAV